MNVRVSHSHLAKPSRRREVGLKPAFTAAFTTAFELAFAQAKVKALFRCRLKLFMKDSLNRCVHDAFLLYFVKSFLVRGHAHLEYRGGIARVILVCSGAMKEQEDIFSSCVFGQDLQRLVSLTGEPRGHDGFYWYVTPK